jgi:two-component system CheB/CheR fusion protein
LRRLLEEVLPKNARIEDYLVEHKFPEIGMKKMLLNARRMSRADKKGALILLAIEEVTDECAEGWRQIPDQGSQNAPRMVNSFEE